MNSSEIRQRFVDYYQGLGFHLLPRAPMLHHSIPMSFVMSAGLVQVETSLAHARERPGDQFIEKRWGMPHLLTAATLREKGLAFAEAEYREALEIWGQQPHN